MGKYPSTVINAKAAITTVLKQKKNITPKVIPQISGTGHHF
jgi:hypothetical protein